jgi:hypothetical protein
MDIMGLKLWDDHVYIERKKIDIQKMAVIELNP